MKIVCLRIISLPVYTPVAHPVFASGNFNNWKKADPDFMFHREHDGTSILEFKTDKAEINLKLNRGDWTLTEGDELLKPVPVRTFRLKEGVNHFTLSVSSWTDFAEEHFLHTASPNVQVIKHDFYIPQLNRTRRVLAYLPPDYHSTEKSYPVLYAMDGQNLFDSYKTPGGEWNMDESMDQFFSRANESVIIVAIDNGGEKRIDEYAPWKNPAEGGGEGSLFAAFLTETLKPFIDLHFRTKPGYEHTGIIGSSMGALVSLYTVAAYPDVFGMAAVFSPSLWFSDQWLAFINGKNLSRQRFFLLAGSGESDRMEPDLLQLYYSLIRSGTAKSNIYLDLQKDGQHNEWFWGKSFQKALEWLYYDRAGSNSPASAPVRVAYNPDTGYLEIFTDQRLSAPEAEVVVKNEIEIIKRSLFYCTNYIRIPFSAGELTVRIFNKGRLIFTNQVYTSDEVARTA